MDIYITWQVGLGYEDSNSTADRSYLLIGMLLSGLDTRAINRAVQTPPISPDLVSGFSFPYSPPHPHIPVEITPNAPIISSPIENSPILNAR